LGETAPASVSKTSPKATAAVRFTRGVAVMVSTWVSATLPVKLKVDGVTLTVKLLGTRAEPVAVQLVGTVLVLRTVRVQVQFGVQFISRTDGTFTVLGSPPVEGLAAR
jgi:hypothetical protein